MGAISGTTGDGVAASNSPSSENTNLITPPTSLSNHTSSCARELEIDHLSEYSASSRGYRSDVSSKNLKSDHGGGNEEQDLFSDDENYGDHTEVNLPTEIFISTDTYQDEYQESLIKVISALGDHIRPYNQTNKVLLQPLVFTVESEEAFLEALGQIAASQSLLKYFINERLKFDIYEQQPDQSCILTFDMPGDGHDSTANLLINTILRRFHIMSEREGSPTIEKICREVQSTGTDSWMTLKGKMPDHTLSWRLQDTGAPGFQLEVGKSQSYDKGDACFLKKAIKQMNISQGAIHMIVWFDINEMELAVIGSIHDFPNKPQLRLSGSQGGFAVEVLPLTCLASDANADLTLDIPFMYCGAGCSVAQFLHEHERAMKVSITFHEIKEMICWARALKRTSLDEPFPAPISTCIGTTPVAFDGNVARLPSMIWLEPLYENAGITNSVKPSTRGPVSLLGQHILRLRVTLFSSQGLAAVIVIAALAFFVSLSKSGK